MNNNKMIRVSGSDMGYRVPKVLLIKTAGGELILLMGSPDDSHENIYRQSCDINEDTTILGGGKIAESEGKAVLHDRSGKYGAVQMAQSEFDEMGYFIDFRGEVLPLILRDVY